MVRARKMHGLLLVHYIAFLIEDLNGTRGDTPKIHECLFWGTQMEDKVLGSWPLAIRIE